LPHFSPGGKWAVLGKESAIGENGKTLIMDSEQLPCFLKEKNAEEYIRKKQTESKTP
jgi:hypothetical protein